MSPFILVAWLAVAGDMPPKPQKPEEESETTRLRVACNPVGLCMIAKPDLQLLVEANNFKAEEITRLEDEIKALKASKGCAKLEVLPKLKRERDT